MPCSAARYLSGLKRWQRALFAVVICAAIGVNVFFLYANVQRMKKAAAEPVSQISERLLDVFPTFVIILQFPPNARQMVSCYEGHEKERDVWRDHWPCAFNKTISLEGDECFVIQPRVTFRQSFNNTALRIDYRLIGSTCFYVAIIDPANVERYLKTNWTAEPGSLYAACAGDTHGLMAALSASATEYVNNSIRFRFHLAMRRSPYRNTSTIWIMDNELYYAVAWNKHSVSFMCEDVVVSTASILSVTVAIVAFLFPFRSISEHRFQFVGDVIFPDSSTDPNHDAQQRAVRLLVNES